MEEQFRIGGVSASEQSEIDAAKCQPAHVSHVEPDRAPLPHFNQRTEFDNFYDFVVTRSTTEPASSTHPLQRTSEGGLHGSAHLLLAR